MGWRDGGDGEVTVHRVALERPDGEVAALRALLSPDEHDRAARYVLPLAARTFVVTRAVLRQVVAETLGGRPEDVAFVPEEARPRVAGTGLDVNVTHSGDWSLVAVSRTRRVGVDLERVRPVDAESVARRFFPPEDAAVIEALPEGARDEVFFERWVMLEAAVKASGTGLAGRAGGDARDGWHVAVVPPPAPGYVAALATDVAATVGYRTR